MDFTAFFKQATGEGHAPFPYQTRLADADLSHGALAAPTGAGKTAAAVLAWLWQRRNASQATPTRLILCEPQRTLVEQVYNEVHKWLINLDLGVNATHLISKPQTDKVSLHAMQGGFVDERWELHPEQPAIIVGTQDQLLSRALNRGYAMSRFRWPVHFGLFHNDVQWVFDEVQLMGPALTTSAQLHGLRKKFGFYGRAKTLWMSATINPGWLDTIDHRLNDCPLSIDPSDFFGDEDKAVPAMARRLNARKPIEKLHAKLESNSKKETDPYLQELSETIEQLHQSGQFTLVIVNTVDRARGVYRRLAKSRGEKDLYLLHSRFRPQDRQDILEKILTTRGEKLVISTQVVEAGVDFSADILVTELAPRASLIQRFGRCNRRGEQDHARVYWTEVQGKGALPYAETELAETVGWLESLESVEPSRFMAPMDDDWPLFDTLRRKDLLELFNTAPDLSGLTVDVGRFIRDGEERDVFVFWRDWIGQGPNKDLPAPNHRELCKVKLSDVYEVVKKGYLWVLDDLGGRSFKWRKARRDDIAPGRSFLMHTSAGHYSPTMGWWKGAKNPVLDLSTVEHTTPFPAMGEDELSLEVRSYLTLEQHTADVCQELDSIMQGRPGALIGAEARQHLCTAAQWHDIGKAHPVFQETMTKGAPDDIDVQTLWAKRVGGAAHSRSYFRHELASAIAALQNDLPFLISYLIASHHGKARLGIRAFPDEKDAILGICEGDALPAMCLCGVELTTQTLSLKPFELGVGSWQDRCLSLLAHRGPFHLAYLEGLLRAADVRASIKEKRQSTREFAHS